MSRPRTSFNIDSIEFSNGVMNAEFTSEPEESASFWKAVAQGQQKRLDKAVAANKENRQARQRAEKRVESLKGQLAETRKDAMHL